MRRKVLGFWERKQQTLSKPVDLQGTHVEKLPVHCRSSGAHIFTMLGMMTTSCCPYHCKYFFLLSSPTDLHLSAIKAYRMETMSMLYGSPRINLLILLIGHSVIPSGKVWKVGYWSFWGVVPSSDNLLLLPPTTTFNGHQHWSKHRFHWIKKRIWGFNSKRSRMPHFFDWCKLTRRK